MAPSLQPLTGPPCPNCGCRDTEILAATEGWYGPQTHRSCNHCREEFTVGERDHRCPQCFRTETLITKTITAERTVTRYHKCKRCPKSTWKSIERRQGQPPPATNTMQDPNDS